MITQKTTKQILIKNIHFVYIGKGCEQRISKNKKLDKEVWVCLDELKKEIDKICSDNKILVSERMMILKKRLCNSQE